MVIRAKIPGPRPRLAFLIPYTGPWPRWSRLFFESVRRNPLIDVILVCERAPSFSLPPNVIVHRLTRAGLTERLRSVTGLPLPEVWGHKLCDFKPFYGLAFSDLLQPYDFWGYCDVDLIFGDLSKLLTPTFLNDLDVFSAHHSSIVGHFTIIRNNEVMNRICFTIENWRTTCTSPISTLMDEGSFALALYRAVNIRWKRPDELVVELNKDFCCVNVTFDYDGTVAGLPCPAPAIVHVRSGKAFYDDGHHSIEILYVHFQGLKRWWHWVGFSKLRDTYRLSSIGYGGPHRVDRFFKLPWCYIWNIQIFLTNCKAYCGNTLRRFLPLNTFLTVRRVIYGRGRY